MVPTRFSDDDDDCGLGPAISGMFDYMRKSREDHCKEIELLKKRISELEESKNEEVTNG